jgi:hypothetical protein
MAGKSAEGQKAKSLREENPAAKPYARTTVRIYRMRSAPSGGPTGPAVQTQSPSKVSARPVDKFSGLALS